MAFCFQPYGTNYYTFSISQKFGKFDFLKHSSRGWETIVRNKSTILLKEFPNPNILGVFFNNGEVKLYINNNLVYSYKDEEPLTCSRLGFFVDDGEFNMQGDDIMIYKSPAIPTPVP